jgi:hypothetical protein
LKELGISTERISRPDAKTPIKVHKGMALR